MGLADPGAPARRPGVAVASGAIPVYWLARKHFDSEWPAAALAVAYLPYPPVQWLTMSDFHPVALACPLLLYAWWHLDERRLLAFALLAAAAIATKEHVGLAVAAMGVWYAVRYRAPRTGAAIVLLAGAAALVATLVVVPHFAPAGASAFESRYDSPSLDGRDLTYLASLLFPLAFLPLAAPLALLAAVPELGLNLLSTTHPDLRQDALRGSGDAGSPRGGGLRRRAAGLGPAYVAALMASLRRDPARPARPRRPRRRRARRSGPARARRRPRRCAGQRDELPRRASLRPPADLQLPAPPRGEWVVVDEQRLTFLDSLKPGRSRPALAELRRDPRWTRVFAEDGVLVFRRT